MTTKPTKPTKKNATKTTAERFPDGLRELLTNRLAGIQSLATDAKARLARTRRSLDFIYQGLSADQKRAYAEDYANVSMELFHLRDILDELARPGTVEGMEGFITEDGEAYMALRARAKAARKARAA
jgi:hypothetical protein